MKSSVQYKMVRTKNAVPWKLVISIVTFFLTLTINVLSFGGLARSAAGQPWLNIASTQSPLIWTYLRLGGALTSNSLLAGTADSMAAASFVDNIKRTDFVHGSPLDELKKSGGSLTSLVNLCVWLCPAAFVAWIFFQIRRPKKISARGLR
jgi:hypothetical protein